MAIAGQRVGQGTRLLKLRALMSLALERRLANRVVPELKQEIFDALSKTVSNTVSLDGGILKIDLREPRRELATSLRDLRRARRLVTINPEIMSGSPVFRRIRVPVHMIATMLAKGDTPESLCEAYPP